MNVEFVYRARLIMIVSMRRQQTPMNCMSLIGYQ